MTAIGDVINALQLVVSELENAEGARNEARGETDKAISQAAALGSADDVAGLVAVGEAIDELAERVAGVTDSVQDVIQMARALADGL